MISHCTKDEKEAFHPNHNMLLDQRGQVHDILENQAMDHLDVMIPDQLGASLGCKLGVLSLASNPCVKHLHCCSVQLLNLLSVSIFEELIQVVFCRGFILITHIGELF